MAVLYTAKAPSITAQSLNDRVQDLGAGVVLTDAALVQVTRAAHILASQSFLLVVVPCLGHSTPELQKGELWVDVEKQGLDTISHNNGPLMVVELLSLGVCRTGSPSVAVVPVEANFPLFVTYTSGSTGKPKGVVHCHGFVAGILLTMTAVFDSVPGVETALVVATPGWITGQAYMICGCLASRVTTIVGAANMVVPHRYRFAATIKSHNVRIFKAGVTFLKAVMNDPEALEIIQSYKLQSTLRVATFCAEPVSPSVQAFGMESMTSQYINSYWGTEHGGIVLSCPFESEFQLLTPDARTYALPWIFAEVWVPSDTENNSNSSHRIALPHETGELVITKPYPYLARTLWGEQETFNSPGWQGDLHRFREHYFSRFAESVFCQGENVYFHYLFSLLTIAASSVALCFACLIPRFTHFNVFISVPTLQLLISASHPSLSIVR